MILSVQGGNISTWLSLLFHYTQGVSHQDDLECPGREYFNVIESTVSLHTRCFSLGWSWVSREGIFQRDWVYCFITHKVFLIRMILSVQGGNISTWLSLLFHYTQGVSHQDDLECPGREYFNVIESTVSLHTRCFSSRWSWVNREGIFQRDWVYCFITHKVFLIRMILSEQGGNISTWLSLLFHYTQGVSHQDDLECPGREYFNVIESTVSLHTRCFSSGWSWVSREGIFQRDWVYCFITHKVFLIRMILSVQGGNISTWLSLLFHYTQGVSHQDDLECPGREYFNVIESTVSLHTRCFSLGWSWVSREGIFQRDWVYCFITHKVFLIRMILSVQGGNISTWLSLLFHYTQGVSHQDDLECPGREYFNVIESTVSLHTRCFSSRWSWVNREGIFQRDWVYCFITHKVFLIRMILSEQGGNISTWLSLLFHYTQGVSHQDDLECPGREYFNVIESTVSLHTRCFSLGWSWVSREGIFQRDWVYCFITHKVFLIRMILSVQGGNISTWLSLLFHYTQGVSH